MNSSINHINTNNHSNNNIGRAKTPRLRGDEPIVINLIIRYCEYCYTDHIIIIIIIIISIIIIIIIIIILIIIIMIISARPRPKLRPPACAATGQSCQQ